ncbi:MAG: hypothetical protein AAF602_11150 [Myxococcota bacterium]
MAWFLALPLAHAAPDDLAARWAAVQPTIAERTPVPVPLSAADLASLAKGESVASRFDTDRGSYATAAIWVNAPIDQVWLVVCDGEHEPADRSTVRVLDAPPGIRRVHITLALPWPIADRQWVSDIVPSRGLYDATSGRVWQRTWDLKDPALATDPDKGVWLKENRGAWTLVDVGQGTLMLFTVRTVLGGMLPASITQGWAVRRLRTQFEETEARALGMVEHYDESHFVVKSPAGREIPRFPR